MFMISEAKLDMFLISEANLDMILISQIKLDMFLLIEYTFVEFAQVYTCINNYLSNKEALFLMYYKHFKHLYITLV